MLNNTAFIKPDMLKLARITADIDIDDAAREAEVSRYQYLMWENGCDCPTNKQVIILAERFKRPLSFLFLR